LVVLYFLSQNGGGSSSDATITPVFQVSGITPEVAQIRSNERIAQIEANKDTALGWIAYQLGIGVSNNEVTTTQITSDNQVKSDQINASAAAQVASAAASAQIQSAQISADASKYVAQQQNKGKNTAAAGGIISGIASIISLF